MTVAVRRAKRKDLAKLKAAVQRLEGSAYRIADALYSSADSKKTAGGQS